MSASPATPVTVASVAVLFDDTGSVVDAVVTATVPVAVTDALAPRAMATLTVKGADGPDVIVACVQVTDRLEPAPVQAQPVPVALEMVMPAPDGNETGEVTAESFGPLSVTVAVYEPVEPR